jgi:transposase
MQSNERGEVNRMAKTYRPEQIADALGVSGKIVRAYLRRTFPRPIESKGSTWVLNAEQAQQTLEFFKAKNPSATPEAEAK